jgi:SAM-dependent methyltransferase
VQESVKLFVKVLAQAIPSVGPVYEFGSLQVPGQEGWADLRSFFPGIEYIGCDMRPGPGVDRVEDLERGLTIPDGQAAVVLSMETLEHVFDVFSAVAEMKRVLRPDEAVLAISSVMRFKIHGYPHDYWRYTPHCFVRLLSDMDLCLTGSLGDPRFPVSVFGIGVRSRQRKDHWRAVLNRVSETYAEELHSVGRYDRTLLRKIKLRAYRTWRPKVYEERIFRTKTTWTLHEAGREATMQMVK